MPITYLVDMDAAVIQETWTGEVDADCLGSYWTAYLADPEVMAIRRTVVDMREARIRFNGAELARLVRSVVTPALSGRDWKTALIVADPVQFGVSRQYHVFAEHYSRDAIFDNSEDAIRWLSAERD